MDAMCDGYAADKALEPPSRIGDPQKEREYFTNPFLGLIV